MCKRDHASALGSREERNSLFGWIPPSPLKPRGEGGIRGKTLYTRYFMKGSPHRGDPSTGCLYAKWYTPHLFSLPLRPKLGDMLVICFSIYTNDTTTSLPVPTPKRDEEHPRVPYPDLPYYTIFTPEGEGDFMLNRDNNTPIPPNSVTDTA